MSVMPLRLKQFYGKLGRLDKVFLLVLLAYLVLRIVSPYGGLALLATLAVYGVGIVEAVRLARFGIRKAIWGLRNRLVVAYLFIAVVPVILILTLVALGGYAVLGQVACYLVTSEFDRRTSELLGPARMLAISAGPNRSTVLARLGPYFERRFPGLEIVVQEGPDAVRYPAASSIGPPPAGWGETSGMVAKGNLLYGWAHVIQGKAEVTFLAPLTRDVVGDLVPGLGDVSAVYGSQPGDKSTGVRLGSTRVSLAKLRESRRKDRLPPPINRFDVDFTWVSPVGVSLWSSPSKVDIGMLTVHSRTSAVLRTVFGQTALDFGTGIFTAFVAVAVLFLLVELVSLIIGVSLTRTITGAVHELYEGTQRVKEGDFAHRITVRGNDQLAELATSFNTMTENLGRLIVVAKEKERLQSELEIAREVQNAALPEKRPRTGDPRNRRYLQPGPHGFRRLLRFHGAGSFGRLRHRRRGRQGNLRRAADGRHPVHHAHAAFSRHGDGCRRGNGGPRRTLSTSHWYRC